MSHLPPRTSSILIIDEDGDVIELDGLTSLVHDSLIKYIF
jgi:hypothetical protein